MNTYKITTREILYRTYEIEADNETEAKQKFEDTVFYTDDAIHEFSADEDICEVEIVEKG